MRALLKTALLCGLFVIPGFAAKANDSSDAFSGVWKVMVQPDDNASQAGKQAFEDMVLFENGNMSASACASLGFAPSSYSIGQSGSTFSVAMATETESIQWSGQASGNQLQGQVVWSKSNGEVFHYTLSGSRQIDQADQSVTAGD